MESFVHRRTGHARWHCRESWAQVLLGPKGLRLDEWLGDGDVEVVKHGPHRSVYRVRVERREFFVKHFRCCTIWDRLRHWFRRSPARREWLKAERIAKLGISTIRPVAWQEETGRGPVGDSFLVTEAILNGCSLDEYQRRYLPLLSPNERRTVGRRLLTDLARFMGRIHQSGIHHHDLHPGNVVVLLEGDRPLVDRERDCYRFHLIDVGGVRFTKALTWSATRTALAVLNAAWGGRMSRTDRYRFWESYLAVRPRLKVPPSSQVIQQLKKRTERYCRFRLRRLDRRTLRTNHDFVALRTPSGRSHGVSEMPVDTLRKISASAETLLWENMHQPVKLDRGSLIVEADLCLGDDTVHVAYKRYRARKWWKQLLAPFRPARAVQSWKRGHALQLRGIPAARPVVAVERRRPWYRCESYLAVQWIEGSENLHLYLWRMAEKPTQVRMCQANRCAESIGRLLGRMHAQRVLHGDLKGSNLLVADRNGRIESFLVDVDDVCLDADTSRANRVADLARLAASLEAHPWVSRTVRLRFLRAYLKAAGQNSTEWKCLWQAIARRSGRINHRKRRKQQAIL